MTAALVYLFSSAWMAVCLIFRVSSCQDFRPTLYLDRCVGALGSCRWLVVSRRRTCSRREGSVVADLVLAVVLVRQFTCDL